MRLQDGLRDCTLALLRKIAVNHRLVVGEDLLRSELAQLLLGRLLDEEWLAGFLRTLSAEEICLLQQLRDQDWMVKAFVLERRFPRHRDGDAADRGEQGPTISLLQKGLLFRGFAAKGSWRGEVYYLPEELHSALSGFLPASVAERILDVRSTQQPDTVARRTVPFDLFCLLSFVRRQPQSQLRGEMSRALLGQLEREVTSLSTDLLVGRWEERWRFLIHLCLQGGWLARKGEFLRPARAAGRLLAEQPGEIRGRLIDRYLKDRGWSELAAAGKVKQMLGAGRIDETAARRLLVHNLSEMAIEGWIDEDSFCESVRLHDPDFLREDHASPSFAVVELSTGLELYGPDSWNVVEGEWIRYLLRGPLHWLGLVEWGLGPGGRAVGFRWIGDEIADEPGEVAAKPEILVEDSIRLAVPVPGDLRLLYSMEPYMELLSRDKVSRYRVTRASLLAGLEAGGSWDELRRALETLVGPDLPAQVTERAEEWASGYGRFLLEGATLVTASTEEDAELLATAPEFAENLQSRLGARVYRVAADRFWKLLEALKKAGYVPKVEPTARAELVRRTAGDLELLRESLFALKLLRSLGSDWEKVNRGAEVVKRLESILEAEELEQIDRRVQDATRRQTPYPGDTSSR